MGMAGPASELALLQRMGVAATMKPTVDWAEVQRDVVSGNPVIIDTPKHYFVATAFDPQTGKFNFQASGTALKAGREWMTPAEVNALSPARSALFLDYPHTPMASPAAGRSPLGSMVEHEVPPADTSMFAGFRPEPSGVMPGSSQAPTMDFETWLSGSSDRMKQIYQSMSVVSREDSIA